MKFFLRALYATDELQTCMRFHDGHSTILTDLGLENLTSNIQPWMSDPNQIVLILEDEDGDLVGGIRVQKYVRGKSIPLCDALGEIDAEIYTVFNREEEAGTAESCGLWNSKKVYGLGLSRILALTSVAITPTLGCKSLFCFSAPYTFKMISALGFVPVEEVGIKGKFHYPTEKFISTVLWIPDLYSLKYAQLAQRERIISLMTNPIQQYKEVNSSASFEVHYNLLKSISFES